MSSEHSTESPVETVERLARLARIALPEEDKEHLAAEFDSVLLYIAQLDGLTLSLSKTPAVPLNHNTFRADENPHQTGSWTESIIAAFPSRSGYALSVKKILSHD